MRSKKENKYNLEKIDYWKHKINRENKLNQKLVLWKHHKIDKSLGRLIKEKIREGRQH